MSKIVRLSAIWVFMATVFTVSMGYKGVAAETGPHGGSVLAGRNGPVEVRVDRPSGRVQVFMAADKDVGNELTLVFERGGGRNYSVALRALPSKAEGSRIYQGALDPSRASYTGFELRIPLSQGGTETLRHSD
jgi:hypothetical protein